jgi:hypothetical protein
MVYARRAERLVTGPGADEVAPLRLDRAGNAAGMPGTQVSAFPPRS